MKPIAPFQILNHCSDWLMYRQITLPAKERIPTLTTKPTLVAIAAKTAIHRLTTGHL